MKKSIYLVLMGLLSNLAAAQWSQISTNGEGTFFFVNDTLGFGAQKRSVDGGVTWQSMSTGAGANVDIHFTDTDTGHMVVNTNTGPPTYQRSFDGGITWVDESASFPNPFGATQVVFPSSSIGYAGSNKFYKTSDGGNSWNLVYSGSIASSSMNFTSTDTGYVGGNRMTTPYLLKTYDGGNSWDSSAIPFTSTNIFLTKTFAATSQDIYAINAYDNGGEILYSSDGGVSWTRQFIDSDMTFADVFFPSKNVGYVSGTNYKVEADSGLVLKTQDGGLTWNVQQTGYHTHLGGLYFTDDDHGWVGGTFGDVLFTANGGQSIGIDEKALVQDYSLYPNPTDGMVTLQFSDQANSKTLFLYDLMGQLIRVTPNIQGDHHSMDMSDLSEGVYLFVLLIGETKTSGRIVKF